MLVYEDREGRRTTRHLLPRRWIVAGDRFTAHCELRGVNRDLRIRRFLDCQFALLQPFGDTVELV